MQPWLGLLNRPAQRSRPQCGPRGPVGPTPNRDRPPDAYPDDPSPSPGGSAAATPASWRTAPTNCVSGSAPTKAPRRFTTVRGTPCTPNALDSSGNSSASIVIALTRGEARAIRLARLTAWGQ